MARKRVVFHVDVNSAYLAWEAVHRLQKGSNIDFRTLPAVVGGEPEKRRGIVLAKSIPAKKDYKIQTGEPLGEARKKCPHLQVLPPNYALYLQCSNAMISILERFSPLVERYSIDEAFLDYSGEYWEKETYINAAHRLKEIIKIELGFTVNVGIGPNKLLAKMAAEFKKPDQVHTLFQEELSQKLWPLPVSELFMVGKATERKLINRGIKTIGELAKANPEQLQLWLKSHGMLIWHYANGREDSPVSPQGLPIKGLGNSTTTPRDIKELATAELLLLSLTENVMSRLRKIDRYTQKVSVSFRDLDFYSRSHQRKLAHPTNATMTIFRAARQLLQEIWPGKPIRHMGISLGSLSAPLPYQYSLTDLEKPSHHALDAAIDQIREKYGHQALFRSSFLNTPCPHMAGGIELTGDWYEPDEYPMMSSLL